MQGGDWLMQTPSSPLRILVVDDEPLAHQTLAEFLSIDGHTVEPAANGAMGLARYEQGAFDLVMTALAMPELDGRAMAAAIRQRNPLQPIIMVTGLAGGGMFGSPEANPDVDLILGKPVSMNALREAVAKMMGSRSNG